MPSIMSRIFLVVALAAIIGSYFVIGNNPETGAVLRIIGIVLLVVAVFFRE